MFDERLFEQRTSQKRQSPHIYSVRAISGWRKTGILSHTFDYYLRKMMASTHTGTRGGGVCRDRHGFHFVPTDKNVCEMFAVVFAVGV